MKKTIVKIIEALLLFAAKKLFDYVDKDKSGSLDSQEIADVIAETRDLLTKTLKKAR